ncbi:succinate dehydrogenase/fumarate reductase flavoprotein subunit [bacterium]|nr:MAG: succinate dehydrogenase/fumarate reductase flavoprotein subunit [bacterium]
MGYPEYMRESLKMVERTRPQRLEMAKKGLRNFVKPMSEEEREEVLRKYHPDYQPDARREVRVGPNKGELLTAKVAEVLESHSRIDPDNFVIEPPDYETDVLIIGGGGAGCMAAIWARKEGAKVILCTKLRLGDANSMMSQGGMQAAVNPHDSPVIHYIDALGGGHFDNKPELLKVLTTEGPKIAKFLEDLGVMWDKLPDGHYQTKPGGGTSRRRMLSCKDYTGAEIMRVLRDEVRNHPEDILVLEYNPAVELVLDEEGKCAGAILMNMETGEYTVVKAKATIIATGGFGRLHIKGFPTTNHYGATMDGVVMAYRAGAKLLYMDSVQYHPTGAVYPPQILGFLITEKIRGFGGQPVNKYGELFVYPLEPRDVEASAIIRECAEGRGIKTPDGHVGVWLDSPIIDLLNGPGTIEKNFPAMVRQYRRFGIDITKEPMLIYPTLHYQNGGIEINEWCETTIPNLLAAGEVTGGVHGRNRLMGNSVLDYNVFGRRAGIKAAELAKKTTVGKLTIEHIKKYEEELREAGIETKLVTPILLPEYRNLELLKKHRKEFDPFLPAGI